MTIQRQFTAVPDIQANTKDISPWQAEFLRGIKQNVDLLAGFQGSAFQAVVRGDVTVLPVGSEGITGEFNAADHVRLATETLLLRQAVNELIANIK